MPTKLQELEIDEGSLVDSPANKGARVVLFKREGEMPDPVLIAKRDMRPFLANVAKALNLAPEQVDKMEEEARTFTQVVADRAADRKMRDVYEQLWQHVYALEESLCSILRDDKIIDKTTAMRTSMVQFAALTEQAIPTWASGKTVEKRGGNMQDKFRTALGHIAKLFGLADTDLDKAVDKALEAQNVPLGPAPVVKAELQPSATEVNKVSDEIQKQMETLTKRADELQKRAEAAEAQAKAAETKAAAAETVAKAEREAREFEGLVKRAGEYANIGKAEDTAKLLKTAYGVSKEYGDQLDTLFKGLHEQIRQGKLFAEIGKDLPTSNAWDEIEKRAEALVAKGTLTKEQAVDKVLVDNPQLYADFKREGVK